MRQRVSSHLQADPGSLLQMTFNFQCRDEIVPILYALQHIYSQSELHEQILALVAADVNSNTRRDRGRSGMDDWQILVLGAVRLGCNLDYDKLQDLAENHRRLRIMMGLDPADEESTFSWKRIRDNLSLLSPETIQQINQLIVAQAHRLLPEAAAQTRADSFVMETNIHYSTESSLIRDGIEVLLRRCGPLAREHGIDGFRQHRHLFKKVKQTAREIDRIASRKGAHYKQRLAQAYRKLLKQSQRVVDRAEALCEALGLPPVAAGNLWSDGSSLPLFILRTRHVMQTARRRVLQGEILPNDEKLFSLFEAHTQLYKRGKAGEPIQFGRLVLVYEDGIGMITHYHLLERDEREADVVVEQTRIVQTQLGGKIQRASFDRGFHSPENQEQLAEILPHVCLPKPGVKQAAKQEETASVEFRQARQNHPGVESAIGALQSGNGLERCRDQSESGFSRYLGLGVLGRNLHTLGRLLMAAEYPGCEAAASRRTG